MTQAREETEDGLGTDLLVDPPQAVDLEPARPMGLTVPLLLAAGWGALLTFSAMFLIEDGRSAVAAPERTVAAQPDIDRAAETRARTRSAAAEVPGEPAVVAASAVKVASVAADQPPPAAPARPADPPIERVGYVGTWGPNPQACGSQSRRHGYLPALITEDGAKAGRTLCRFRNGRRDGIAWTVSADCSERGRNWTSQVRLLVDGDRLIWTSAKGSSSYVRCGRRDG